MIHFKCLFSGFNVFIEQFLKQNIYSVMKNITIKANGLLHIWVPLETSLKYNFSLIILFNLDNVANLEIVINPL